MGLNKKILFLVLHRPDRSPGQRFRHEQYVSFLEENGFTCEFSPLLTEEDDRIFYGNGNYLRKIRIGLKTLMKRWKDARKAHEYDLVYVYRDAYFFGTFIERRLAKSKVPIVYDFDDAIWLSDENPNQGVFNKLKTPDKIKVIIGLSTRVVVGNAYLASYARAFNQNVTIIPSTVDMEKYAVQKAPETGNICIGWSGSFSTIKHFETVLPAFTEIKRKYGDRVWFKLIGEPNYVHQELGIQGVKWQSETEAQDLAEFSIGIMPLPDTQWTRGKCAMKGLQYMALGIPTVMSPVGVNADIIQEGVNGMLATTTEEWVDKLSMLIEDEALRQRLGEAGKETVIRDFSVKANKEKWLGVFQSV